MDISQEVTSTVRVINHSDKEFTLLQDTVLDAAEKIEIKVITKLSLRYYLKLKIKMKFVT